MGRLRRLRWLDDAGRDLRHAGRVLRRNPLFTATAVLSVLVLLAGWQGFHRAEFTFAENI